MLVPTHWTLADLNRLNQLRIEGNEWRAIARQFPGRTWEGCMSAAKAYKMLCVLESDRTAAQEKAEELRKVFEEHPEYTDKQAGAVIGWDKNKTYYYRSRVLKLPDRAGRLLELSKRDTMTDPRQFD